jgi:hypothetical protein
MSKRIVFTTKTPNDQGGIIPDDVIDFTRFNKNPVVLKEHRWSDDPIGLWTDIKKESEGWSGVPVFHGLTEESKTTKALYEGGFLRAASIGGEAIWKTNSAGQYALDKNGLRVCDKFYLYEISIVTLPSNEDAVQTDPVELHAKIYEPGEIENINKSITTLSSKFYTNTMAKDNATNETGTQQTVTEPAAKPVNEPGEKTTLSTDGPGLPKWLKEIIGLGGVIKFGADKNAAAPAPKDEPVSTTTDKDIANPQPKPTGLSVEKAKEKAEKAKEKAEKAQKKAEEAKKKADAEDATDELKSEYETCMEDAEKALKEAEEAEAAYEKAKKAEDDDDDDEDDKEKAKEKSKNSAMKPQRKTLAELQAEQVKLAAKPQTKVVSAGNGKTFSQLASDKGEGRAILNRVMTRDAGEKQIGDYAVVLNAILADTKYAALHEKMRLHINVTEGQLASYRENIGARGAGLSIKDLSAQFNAGQIEIWDRTTNSMKQITTLSSTDNALASPALNTIEWLPLAIFKLFPTTSWKNEIPIFSAQITGANTGIIWANIAADPTIYKGNQPSSPSDYTYSDTAVALSLTPYWLQPMRWTPLTMHQLRYDQMGTGWAQAFSKLNATIDDNLLYTLAAAVPAGSIILTSGISGNNATATIFNISGSNDPNAFYWNPSFTGNLKAPVLNDIITLEQLYNKQNFELESERPYLVMDPTMEAIISKDPETKSLLTRWVNADGADLLKFKHTVLNQRSRVAVYDPATAQVKDINSVIPATSVSGCVGFIPSQIGMGLGMLDVFMIQDPTNYGYKMSADLRMGIAPLRADGTGLSLLTYAAGNV